MKNKRNRLQVIIELVKKNCIGSQNELAELLKQHGIEVTQATLSRDLKTLKVTKVANDAGEYMYIIPDSNELQDSMLMKGQKGLTGGAQIGFVSLDYSGNIAVIKTRNGYATGLAYDIDMSHWALSLVPTRCSCCSERASRARNRTSFLPDSCLPTSSAKPHSLPFSER